ncbi:MAG: cation-translocating P-type ATPase [Patescibacteria group bacterium]
MEHSYCTQPIDRVFTAHRTSAAGLSSAEAIKRGSGSRPNQLPGKKRLSGWRILLAQFKSILIYILLGAAVVTLILDDRLDTYVILAAVAVNVIVGFIQEYRAQRSLELLRKVVTHYTVVRRDGKRQTIDATELVVGDVVYLAAGAKVPADVRLYSATELQINESSLTGESNPITKVTDPLPSAVLVAEQRNMAFMGTVVVNGSGEGVVVGIGTDTELGKIATLLATTEEESTPLQQKLVGLGKLLGYIILGVAFVIFIIGLVMGYEVRATFATAVALAVAAIPEGLAVVVTVTLAIGMQRILKHKALVRKLVAAETLGSTSVICTDKTGTLTEGEMQVVRVITYSREFDTRTSPALASADAAPAQSYFLALQIGVLASDAYIENPEEAIEHRTVVGMPTEKALILVATQAGIDLNHVRASHPRRALLPFNSRYKYMASLNDDPDHGLILNVKGAPEILLHRAAKVDLDGTVKSLDKTMRDRLRRQYQQLSGQGLRLLGLGYKFMKKTTDTLTDDPALLDDLVFVGFAVIKDPLRADARETIQRCIQAGIRPVMLTGDHRLTARAIAEEVGLPHQDDNIIEGEEFAKLSREELMSRIHTISVYARVTPEDKLRIIDAWQERGEVVAMTGDGVNDAPALKSADIGVALGSGTDVAKESADMVLIENNFSTIVRAVEQGRIIFDNIKKAILFLLSDSFTLMLLVTLSLFFHWPLPLVAVQILWINLVTDSFPSIGLTLEAGEQDIMSQKPVSRTMPIIDREMKILIGVVSVLIGLLLLGLFAMQRELTGDLDRARTTTFAAAAIATLLYSFSYRSIRHQIWQQNPFRNRPLVLAVLVGLLIQLPVIYIPALQGVFQTVSLNALDWLLALPVGLAAILCIEIIKMIFRHRRLV